MGNIMEFLSRAGEVLADGFATEEEARAFFNAVAAVLAKDTDPSPEDWDALHAYEDKQLGILDSPMEGE